MKKIENYINGNIQSISKDYLDVYNPSSGEVCANVVASNIDDLDSAIKSSQESQINWANTTPLKRSRILFNYKVY